MNSIRSMHASCVIQGYVYVFGGQGKSAQPIGNFERLNESDRKRPGEKWELIQGKGRSAFTVHISIAVTPISDHEILIMGLKSNT